MQGMGGVLAPADRNGAVETGATVDEVGTLGH